MNDLKDRIVMITGASSGFGKEAAKMCVELGAKVVLGARR
jgi:NADP-dependent 3-hydroxy acid dehydrogenase YdfG